MPAWLQFQVYLFESILICCTKRRHGPENPEAAPLRLKGRIFLVNIVDMGVSPGTVWLCRVVRRVLLGRLRLTRD